MGLSLHHICTVGIKIFVTDLERIAVCLFLLKSSPKSFIWLPSERILLMVKAVWAEDEEVELIRVREGLMNEEVDSPLGVDLIA